MGVNAGTLIFVVVVGLLVVLAYVSAKSLKTAKGDIGQDLPDSDDDEDEPAAVPLRHGTQPPEYARDMMPPRVAPFEPKQYALPGGELPPNVTPLRTPEQLDRMRRDRAQKRAAEAIDKAETEPPLDKRPPSKG